jgi:beta-glucosidase
MPEFKPFPPGFLWGASTASHQVEGGNQWNDWWQAEQAGTVPHRSDRACGQYERFASDFDMAREWGHNAHRLSIEWSRIEPSQGKWNEAALDHYRQVIRALRERGIEPLVTLHHFTNPRWFADRGGWVRGDSVQLFARYVTEVVKRLAGEVRYWLPINEPTVYIKRAYVAGSWPPHRRRGFVSGLRVLRNLCRAHCTAYRIIHGQRSDALVGIAHSSPWVEAHDVSRFGDRLVARLRGELLNHLCMRLLREHGRLRLDFIGLNYYARELVRWEPHGLAWLFGTEPVTQRDGSPRRYSGLGWEIHAPGLLGVLREFSRYGLPMIITENGIATDDETVRSDYLESHLRALAHAVGEGIDVRGYCYWSLLDNFEWAEGYTARFGLAAVDFDTLQRSPRPAALRYAAVCHSNGAALMPQPTSA